MRRDRGIALINALVMVAAITGVAAMLMREAEDSRQRLTMVQAGGQATLYLDAAELLVPLLLETDWEDGASVDHLGERWARDDFAVPIDRGGVGGRIADLQGRFNVNWLSDPADTGALQAFARLLRGLELNAALAGAVAQYLAPGGPANPGPYITRDVPVRPAAGPIRAVDELRLVQGMSAEAFARLRPHVAALPANSRLNVNTATLPVLQALLPDAGPGALRLLDADRRGEGFGSVAAFRERVEALVHPRVFETVPAGRLATRSDWFEAALTARLEQTVRARRDVLYRNPETGDVTVEYRLAGEG